VDGALLRDSRGVARRYATANGATAAGNKILRIANAKATLSSSDTKDSAALDLHRARVAAIAFQPFGDRYDLHALSTYPPAAVPAAKPAVLPADDSTEPKQ
jgi:hypothetical protein